MYYRLLGLFVFYSNSLPEELLLVDRSEYVFSAICNLRYITVYSVQMF